jgi:hypothetical protein
MGTSFAGGAMMDMYPSGGTGDIKTILDSIQDKDLKDIISSNIFTIMNNNIAEDYDYNSKHYYSKKFALNITIPEELKSKVTKSYVALIKSPQYGVMDTSTMAKEGVSAPEGFIKIALPTDMGKEIMIQRTDIEKHLTNQYGDSFNGYLVLELEGGIKLPFSNTFYLYIQKN